MKFSLFVNENGSNVRVPVIMQKAVAQDFEKTADDRWQSDWTSDYIQDSGFDLYALKTLEGELVALAAYEICVDTVAVHIVYMESQFESNPTKVQERKYLNIGRAMIVFGIKLSVDAGFNGDVTLDAKTPALEMHYAKDYGAIKVPGRYSAAAPRYLICDNSARRIFTLYLEEGS